MKTMPIVTATVLAVCLSSVTLFVFMYHLVLAGSTPELTPTPTPEPTTTPTPEPTPTPINNPIAVSGSWINRTIIENLEITSIEQRYSSSLILELSKR